MVMITSFVVKPNESVSMLFNKFALKVEDEVVSVNFAISHHSPGIAIKCEKRVIYAGTFSDHATNA